MDRALSFFFFFFQSAEFVRKKEKEKRKKKGPDEYRVCVYFVLLRYIVFISIFQHIGFGREIANLLSNFAGVRGGGRGKREFPSQVVTIQKE